MRKNRLFLVFSLLCRLSPFLSLSLSFSISPRSGESAWRGERCGSQFFRDIWSKLKIEPKSMCDRLACSVGVTAAWWEALRFLSFSFTPLYFLFCLYRLHRCLMIFPVILAIFLALPSLPSASILVYDNDTSSYTLFFFYCNGAARLLRASGVNSVWHEWHVTRGRGTPTHQGGWSRAPDGWCPGRSPGHDIAQSSHVIH